MNAIEQWHLSEEAAELYERHVVRYILGPWSESVVDAACVSTGDQVLDIACGTGVVTRLARERVGPSGRVIGLDLNPGMLGVARSLPTPPGNLIEWVQRSALDLGLASASFDAVLCQQGVQFFPDKALALREMRRVLRKGGRLALSVWKSVGIYNSAVGNALRELAGEEASARFCASRKVPSGDEIRLLMSEAGFVDIEIVARRREVHLPPLDDFALCHLASTPIAFVLAKMDPELRRQIGRRVADQLKSYENGNGVTFPEEIYLATGRV